MIIGSFLLGTLVGLLTIFIEKHLNNLYKESIQPQKWPLCIHPIMLGVISIMLYRIYGSSFEYAMYMIFALFLLVLSVFDLKHMLLPSRVIYSGIGFGIIFKIVQTYLAKDMYFLCSGLLGAVVGYGLFWLVFYGSKWILKKEGLGFGDVRLMALLGLFVGIESLFLMMIVASFLAVVVGGVLYVIKRKSEAFPFGPFLCLGALVMILWGNEIIAVYLNCMGL